MKPSVGSWQRDLVELMVTLTAHGVPFLVVGGYAVAHAGHLRATKDLDLFIPRAPTIDRKLLAALAEFLGDGLSPEDGKRNFLRLFVGRPGAVDILRRLPGVKWRTAWESRTEGLLFGARVPFIGTEALIRNKRAVGRHSDLADVEELLRIRSADRAAARGRPGRAKAAKTSRRGTSRGPRRVEGAR